MMTEQEAKEFMSKSLPERFHDFMLMEMCDEDGYNEMMRNNDYNYLPILQRIKQEMPAEFYAYFHDLLCDEEQDKYERVFFRTLQF